jgi:hypothetical protein
LERHSTSPGVVGGIPVDMRERYNLPNDGTGIDGIHEMHDGSHVAYEVKYRRNHNLTFAEVSPFLGITEKFSDRVIFPNATTLSEK